MGMISNEALFLVILVIDLLLVAIAGKLGKDYLYASVIANLLFTNIVSSKFVYVFGFTTTIGNATYAGIFLATDLLCEHYGKKEARRILLIGFFSLIWIILLGPMVSMFPYPEYVTEQSKALATIFSFGSIISIASLMAYLVSTRIDIEIYAYLKSKWPSKSALIIRNNISTFFGQLIDQAIFVTLAFSFTYEADVLWELFLSGVIIKLFAALIDTPFIWASYSYVKKTKDIKMSEDDA